MNPPQHINGIDFSEAKDAGRKIWIADDGQIVGVANSNRLRSQIQDIANNCDPRLPVRLVSHRSVIEIVVLEGTDKPYNCNEGFFLRIGPNSQQLTRDEILRFAIRSNKVRFDEQFVEPGSALDRGQTDRKFLKGFS